MNKLSQTWQRIPDWLKGAGLGVLTYVVPFVLSKTLTDSPSWSGGEKWLSALLIAAVHPWFVLALPLYIFGIYMFSIMEIPVVRDVVSPLVWALLGAFFSRMWGFRRGCVVLLVLETIVIGIAGFLVLIFGALVDH